MRRSAAPANPLISRSRRRRTAVPAPTSSFRTPVLPWTHGAFFWSARATLFDAQVTARRHDYGASTPTSAPQPNGHGHQFLARKLLQQVLSDHAHSARDQPGASVHCRLCGSRMSQLPADASQLPGSMCQPGSAPTSACTEIGLAPPFVKVEADVERTLRT